jgi:formylglycine-generating enzyme required for sulfatase activity
MSHDVFISHSSKDKAIADATCAALEAAGIRCWVAPRDILAGVNWGEAIIDAIAGSRVIVLILSSESNVSPQVIREIERGVNKGIPIIPLRVQDIPLSKSLEYFLSSAHWLDAYSQPMQQYLDVLVASVGALLAGSSSRPAEAVTPRPLAPRARPRSRLRFPLLGVLSAFVVTAVAVTSYVALRRGSREEVPDGVPIGQKAVATSVQPESTAAPEATVATTGPEPAAGGPQQASTPAPVATVTFLGIAVQELPEIAARHFGVADGGVWVSKVLPEQKADVRAGDMITEVDGKPVRTKKDFGAFDIGPPHASPLTFSIQRDGAETTVLVSRYALPFGSQEYNSYGLTMLSAPLMGECGRLTPPESRGVFLTRRAWVGDGTVLAMAGRGLQAAWRLEKEMHAAIDLPPGTYTAGAVSRDGRVIVLAREESGELLGVNAMTGKQLFLAEGIPDDKTVAAAFEPGGQRVVRIGERGLLVMNEIASQKVISTIDLRALGAKQRASWSSPNACFISPQGRYLMTEHVSECIIWDLTAKELVRRMRPAKSVSSAAPSPDWSQVGFILAGGMIEVWDIEKEELSFALRGHIDAGAWHRGDVTFLTPDLLASVYDGDNSIRFWDLRQRSPVWEYAMDSPACVSYDPATKALIAWARRGILFQMPGVVSLPATPPSQQDPSFTVRSRPSQPASTTSMSFGNGRTRDIVEADDMSRMIIERDAEGNITAMNYVPPPGAVGLGIQLGPAKDGQAEFVPGQKIEEGVRIVSVVAGGRAARDGLLEQGDVIKAVAEGDRAEWTSLDGLQVAEIMRLMLGEEGTTIRLQVLRHGASEPLDVTATRGKIEALRNKAVRCDYTNGIGMEFIAIKGGIGTLGIGNKDPGMARHYARLSKGFLIGAHEVTQGEFAKVMGVRPSAYSTAGSKSDAVKRAVAKGKFPIADTAHQPVESVSWEEAVEFCRRLSKQEQATYRLPTEAEWEWACRNGGTAEWTPDSLSGSSVEEIAVGSHLDFPDTTYPVGTRSPNDIGVYDMLGNVAEWCGDHFTEEGFASASLVDPQGPASSLKRVIRGGSFNDFGFKFFQRTGLAPTEKRPYVGFRVVLEPKVGLVGDKGVEQGLLDTSKWTVDENRIPTPIPECDIPRRTPEEEERDFKAVIDRVQANADLAALRKKLLAEIGSSQTHFPDMRAEWVELNARLGDPSAGLALASYNLAHQATPICDKITLFFKAMENDSLLGWIANDMAWALSTNSNPDFRDPPVAVTKAIEACEEVKWRYWGFLDTLAAALAADGRYESAVRVAEAALARAPEGERAPIELALGRYKEGKPYAEAGH